MRLIAKLTVVSLLGVAAAVYAEKDSPCCQEGKEGAAAEKRSIALAASVKSASAEDGIVVQVRMKNSGDPLSLEVCPAMKLCCVKGLHPLIKYGDKEVGLCDRCEKENPCKHETFLPKGASFVFDVTIPTDCLPEEALQAGKVTVWFCYELGDSKLVESNAEEVSLK